MKRSAAAAPPRTVVSSSPGRAEKLPTAPGLARLLRGKSGSRSRGRSSLARSSPMFVSRSRSVGPSSSRAAAAEAEEEEGEPSSPKVTCIGQVRIRNKKSKSKPSLSNKSQAENRREQQQDRPTMRCRCLERALLCQIFTRKPSSGRPRRSLWRRWTLSLRSEGKSSYQQRKSLGSDIAYSQPEAAASGTESDGGGGESEETESESEEEGETRVFMSSAATTPPKNALLLMRCRSAPHNRSSSLAIRFAVSPLPASEASTVENLEKSASVGGGIGEEQEAEERRSEVEAVRSPSSPSRRPLVLTRCKSEPAKTAEKLVAPEETACCISNSNSRGSSKQSRLALVHEDEPPPPPPPLPR